MIFELIVAIWRNFWAQCLCRKIPLIQLCWVAYPAQIWQQHFLGRIGSLRQSRKNLVAGVVYSTLCCAVCSCLPPIFCFFEVKLYFCTTLLQLYSKCTMSDMVKYRAALWSFFYAHCPCILPCLTYRLMVTQRARCNTGCGIFERWV